MKNFFATLDRQKTAVTLMRVFFGYLFLMHGFAIPDYDILAAEHYFSTLGLPGIFAIFVSALEICGGFMLIVGLLTRWTSYAFLLMFLGALVYGQHDVATFGNWQTPGSQIVLVFMTVVGYFALTGDYGYAFDNILDKSAKNQKKR
ncbi:MAG: DoxX family protein [Tumebacillaceae bacterium]